MHTITLNEHILSDMHCYRHFIQRILTRKQLPPQHIRLQCMDKILHYTIRFRSVIISAINICWTHCVRFQILNKSHWLLYIWCHIICIYTAHILLRKIRYNVWNVLNKPIATRTEMNTYSLHYYFSAVDL